MKRRWRLLLSMLILVAAGLRLWGIDYDLPYIYHPDEPVPISITLNMLKTGDLHPHFFHWPSLLLYLNLLAYVPYFYLGKLLGSFHTTHDILAPIQITMGVTYAPMPTAVLLGRLVSVAFGVGSVLLTYLIGKNLTRRSWGGLVAAALMAASPTNVWHSRWIAPDVLAVFFVLAAVYTSILVLQKGKSWSYVLAGISVGLAASSKYNAGLVVLCLVAAHFLRYGLKGFRERKLYIALFLSVLAFCLTTPFAVLDFPEFLEGVTYDSQHYATGHAGWEGDSLKWYLSYLLRSTGPVVLVAVLGMALGLLARSKEMAVVSSFAVAFFVFISSFEVRFERTLLPLMPLSFLLASYALVELLDRATATKSKVIRIGSTVALVSLTAVSVTLLAGKAVQANLKLATPDSRETARVWIEDNVPLETKVALESYSPFVDPEKYEVQGVGRMIDHTPDWYIDSGSEVLVFSEGMFGRFFLEPDRYETEISQYNSFYDRFELLRMFTDGGYEVRIYGVNEGRP